MKAILIYGCAAFFGYSVGHAADTMTGADNSASSYRLTANDVVEIKVYQEDDLETKARIGQDGAISFPLIGIVPVAGKTVEEAAKLIRDKLEKDYLVNPQVTLIVAEYSKRRITVLGQVQKPGSLEMPSEESVTLLQAIAMAGGFSRLADMAHIKVVRMMDGRPETTTVDARRQSNTATLDFKLQPDDTVTVPERLF